MNQKIGIRALRSSPRQFEVRAMHGVLRLKGDDLLPAEPREFIPQLCRMETQIAEIVMGWELDPFDTPAHVPGMRAIEDMRDTGMHPARRAVHGVDLGVAVRLPDFFNVQDSKHHPFRVAECE